MSDFWNNISRYPRFFISSVAGLIFVILAPLKNLSKIKNFQFILPVGLVIVLITLSIIGILFIQITWLQGLFLLQRNQLSEKINQTGLLVVTDIGKKMNSGLSFRLPKRGRLSLENDYHLHKFDESTIADIYDYKELKEKIKSALELMDMKLLDHIIITPFDTYTSFTQEGLL